MPEVVPEPALPAPAPRGPVRERAPLPDVLRGVALAGILIVNMQDFAVFREWQQHGIDRVVQVLTDVIANGRFISIFAMLFGWGAAGLLRRGPGTFLLRHAVLLAVGTVHAVLVWHGDIIGTYGLLGFFLLLTARLEAGALLAVAGALGGVWVWQGLLYGLASVPHADLPRFSGLPPLYAHEPYVAVVAQRAAEYSDVLIGGAVYNGAWLLALFCLGAAAERTGLLQRPQEHVRLLRHLGVWGLVVGVPLGALLAWMNTRGDYATGVLAVPVRMAGGLASALGYVGVIGLLSVRGRLGWLRAFAASGRIAMSNYVAQSLIMTAVFYPYAGAQFGAWGAAPALLLAVVVGGVQVPLSGWLLRRWGTGPLEWVVRALVYGWPIRENERR